jgi:demethylmenaquinone methyltransferase / 2-methoxy-6-polyprenyl-1,4-benzoquinol methylase
MTQTHFGFKTVDEREKAQRVRSVFDSVAPKYDLMNDLMSAGPAPRWKAYTVAVANVQARRQGAGHRRRHRRPGAGLRPPVGPPARWCTPTSTKPCCAKDATACSTTAWCCPRWSATPSSCRSPRQFRPRQVAFGLRNMTHKDTALAEMCRVLRPGGRCWCWSSPRWPSRCEALRLVLLQHPAALGKLGGRDADSYRYLAESIRMHPGQEELRQMMKAAGFGHVDVHNLTGRGGGAACGDQVQAAWDQADIQSLRAMMTEGMLSEIQAQLTERERAGHPPDGRSEVIVMDAQLLGIEELADRFTASVEFSGLMREGSGAGPNPFRELWNISRLKADGGRWQVAGVQALQ